MKVAVIGGGINGVMTAWAFARRGDSVDLFEKGRLMSATSRASTKMLHGGLRYLEHGHLGLVREALQERSWWIRQAPQLARPLELLLPVYRGLGRSRWQIALGVRLYDLLASGSGFPKGCWYERGLVLQRFPTLKAEGLKGAYGYWDAQMDDFRLGLWAADAATGLGVRIHEHTLVEKLDPQTGELVTGKTAARYDRIVNATGPWADRFLVEQGIESAYRLDLVRGSHLVIPGCIPCGCVLQVPGERRILFVLPYGDLTLLGTTEVRHFDPDTTTPSAEEVGYLIGQYNTYFSGVLDSTAIIEVFCGVRPIVATRADFSAASRESIIERNGRLINIFGGKWTTARVLAESVVKLSTMNARCPG